MIISYENNYQSYIKISNKAIEASMGKKKRKTTKKLRRVGKKNSTEVNGNGSVLEAGTSSK